MNSETATTSNQHNNPRLDALRERMRAKNIDAYIVLSTDPHLSEYLPEHWQSRAWLTGFTGSAGFAVVTQNEALLWTDSRYWVQAATQLHNSGFTLMKQSDPATKCLTLWLHENLDEAASIGIDGMTLSVHMFDCLNEQLAEKNFSLITDIDLIREAWPDRPPLKHNLIYAHDPAYCPETRAEKLGFIRGFCEDLNYHFHLISSLDEIAWILNLRGGDVEYNPVFMAHLLLTPTETLLFADESSIPDEIKSDLAQDNVRILPYDEAASTIDALKNQGGRLCIDPQRVVVGMLTNILGQGPLNVKKDAQPAPAALTLLKEINATQVFKACKSEGELDHIRDAMIQDGVALCKFFSSFEAQMQDGKTLTELDVDEQITAARAECELFVSPSFPTIAGFNENGALPHYRATPEQHSVIKGDGLLLIDSGGQYLNGTTDITRVIPIGTPSQEQKADFTYVLKSMIALSMAVFPEKISAAVLDAIARQPLWEQLMDYGHGTGHGVGYFLNVHEGPQSIGYIGYDRPQNLIRAGMVTSNEPGLYREGQWGIRIENLILSLPCGKNEFGSFLGFETLTLCPIDTRCISKNLMLPYEISWLNNYHEQVRDRLAPHLEGQAANWLLERTQPL